MDIHKPKPWHGVREFLKEYLIIVVGVLTALGAEQAVEFVHQRHAAEAAAGSIRNEIQHNITGLMVRRENEPCVSRRLDEIAAVLADPARLRGQPVWVGHPFYASLPDEQLRSAEQAGRASLLPREELARYATIYAYFAQFQEGEAAEWQAWADLRVLEQRQVLTPVSDWQLQSALQRARAARWSMEVSSSLAVEEAAKIGIRPDKVRPWPLHSACLPFHTPRADGLAKVAAGRRGRAYDEP